MTEMRWILSREQVAGAYSEPIEMADGTSAYARLQHREIGLSGDTPWRDVPVVSEIQEAPRIALVPGGRRGH